MGGSSPPEAEEASTANTAITTNKKRKRPRAIQACDRCRAKKYKCSESYPCLHCKKSGLQCHYSRERQLRDEDDDYVQKLEQQVESLTGQVRELADAHRNTASRLGDSPDAQNHDAVASDSNAASVLTGHGTPGGFSTRESGGSEVDSPVNSEITDVNRHTNGIEFHGSTSSLVFLGNLRRFRGQRQPTQLSEENNTSSLVSDLHNARFPTPSDARHESPSGVLPLGENFYFKRAHLFIDAYFSGIHYIHPFINKEDFMARADDLWFGRSPRPPSSFIAMYLSLLSIGALTRTWEEQRLDGLTRFEWSRKLYSEAKTYLNELQFSTDPETVHCLYLLAKVCQNELNPHMAYMYLGQAIRTCLSAGFNREPSTPKTKRSEDLSRTWWGLFSLEIEMSFSLGRSDTLGIDQYHNRRIPEADDSEFAIIPCMTSFGQIIRKVSVDIYHSRHSILHNMARAFQIMRELDDWVHRLPPRIRFDSLCGGSLSSLSALKEPTWCQRQRLVLEIRYHNVMMLLFRPFISYSMQNPLATNDGLSLAVDKGISSAQRTIDVIYETYRLHAYFRTWWYNTTYVLVGASVLLLFMTRSRSESSGSLLKWVEMAVEILEAMDESVVAKKSAEIVRRFVAEVTRPGPLQGTTTFSVGGQTSNALMAADGTFSSFQAAMAPEPNAFESIPGLEFLDTSIADIVTMFEDGEFDKMGNWLSHQRHHFNDEHLEVLVVGAGLGGLSAAISIAAAGHSVMVLEQAREIAEVGAGLQITPNGSRLLQHWQLPDWFWSKVAEPTETTVHRYSGDILNHEPAFHTKMQHKYGAPFIDVHRADLQQAMYARAQELGVNFSLGQRVESFELGKSPAVVKTATGTTFKVDLVVAADGLWSVTREAFLGIKAPPLPTGDLAYRIVLTLDEITDQELRDFVKKPTLHFWIGPGAHVVGYSLRGGTMYNLVLLVPDSLPEGVAREEGSVAEMKAFFEGWDPILIRFLNCVSKVDKWKLMHHETMPNWVNSQGNLVFLGDACHPMLPYLAQGANSSLEDGAVLGTLLRGVKNKVKLNLALHAFQSLRKTRGESIAKETFKQRRDFHMPDGDEQRERDDILRAGPGCSDQTPYYPSRWTCPKIQPWLYGYDAIKDTESYTRAMFAKGEECEV